MLPRDIRCRVISLLLGAVKIERDQHIVSVQYSLNFCNLLIRIVVLKLFKLKFVCSFEHQAER